MDRDQPQSEPPIDNNSSASVTLVAQQQCPMGEGHTSAQQEGSGGRRGGGLFRARGRRGRDGGRGNHGRGWWRGRGRTGGRKQNLPEADSQPSSSEAVPVAEHSAGPVAGQSAGPVAGQSAAPVVGHSAEPVPEQSAEPVPEQPAEPAAEQSAEPAAEQSAVPGGRKQKAPPAPAFSHFPIVWCDICRVYCNSLEILKQHKNGKRHKKTVQRIEEIQRQQKLYAESHGTVMSNMMFSNVELVIPNVMLSNVTLVMPDMVLPNVEMEKASEVGAAVDVSVAPKNIMTGAVPPAMSNASVTVYNNLDTVFSESQQYSEAEASKSQVADVQLQPEKVGNETEAPPVAVSVSEEQLTEGSNTIGRISRGKKRKMTNCGQDGKRLKGFEPVQVQVAQRPREQPRVCTVCNVICETKVVFDTHLAGKKHLSKIRRFQGQGTIFGPITVYNSPNQPALFPTSGEPLFFGLTTYDMLQQDAHVALNGVQGGQCSGAEGGVSETQVLNGLKQQCEIVTASEGKEDAIMDNSENQACVAAALDSESKLLSVARTKASSEFEVAASLSKDAAAAPVAVGVESR